jgi:predicted nuclease of predicted toxin-antitoxin system
MSILGFDAEAVKAALGEGRTDDEVLAYCQREGRVFVTSDRGQRDEAIVWAIAERRDVPIILVPNDVLTYEVAAVLCGHWQQIERMCARARTGDAPYLVADPNRQRLRTRTRPTPGRLTRHRRTGR